VRVSDYEGAGGSRADRCHPGPSSGLAASAGGGQGLKGESRVVSIDYAWSFADDVMLSAPQGLKSVGGPQSVARGHLCR